MAAVRQSGLTVYDGLSEHLELYYETPVLESLLRDSLVGLALNFPLRTRSKMLKSKVCEALGYPVPARFRKVTPRFPGQNFDTYVQKADNLQIWNEEVSSSRRYVLVRVNADDVVTNVRVVDGELLAALDRTGTLTHKYQAKSRAAVTKSVLVTSEDTARVKQLLVEPEVDIGLAEHEGWPQPKEFLAIGVLYGILRGLVGETIRDPGRDQERNRGGELHRKVSELVGRRAFADSGQFPDILEQLLEVKLQTSPTIDLGLVNPKSGETLANVPPFRHRDVRYSVFYGSPVRAGVRIDHVVLTSGEQFFRFFQRFEGKVRNAKLQIPLPKDFFL